MIRRIAASLFMTIVLIAGLTVSSSAQMMRMSPEERAKALKDSLALDSVQTAKALVIFKDSQKAIEEAREKAAGDREAMRGVMQDVMKKTDDQIKSVLNDAQKKKYEEMMKNRPMRGGMRPPRN